MRRRRGSSSGDRRRRHRLVPGATCAWPTTRTLRPRPRSSATRIVPLFVVDDRLWPSAPATTAGGSSPAASPTSTEQLDRRLGRAPRRSRPTVIADVVTDEHGAARLYHAARCVGPVAAARPRRRGRRRRCTAATAQTVVVDQPYAVAARSTPHHARAGPSRSTRPYWRRWLRTRALATPLPHATSRHLRPSPASTRRRPARTAGRPTCHRLASPSPGEPRRARPAVDRFLSTATSPTPQPPGPQTSPAADAHHPAQPLPQVRLPAPPPGSRRARGSPGPRGVADRAGLAGVLRHVLFRYPDTAWRPLRFPTSAPSRSTRGQLADERFEAWAAGRTGYPIVDAGMRQLLTEGWVHNRCPHDRCQLPGEGPPPAVAAGRPLVPPPPRRRRRRPPTTTAGSGSRTGPPPGPPYFRIFNPTAQRRAVRPARRLRPAPRARAGRAAPTLSCTHRGLSPTGPPAGYPAPIVDHATEREEALRRLAALG